MTRDIGLDFINLLYTYGLGIQEISGVEFVPQHLIPVPSDSTRACLAFFLFRVFEAVEAYLYTQSLYFQSFIIRTELRGSKQDPI